MEQDVATYAISSILTLVLLSSMLFGVILALKFIAKSLKYKKVKKMILELDEVEVVTFNSHGMPVILKYKEDKEYKWIFI